MFGKFQFRQTTLIIIACIGFLLGLATSRFGYPISSLWLLAFLPFVLFSLKNRSIVTAISISGLFLTLGWLRGQVFVGNIEKYNNLDGYKVTIKAQAVNDASYDEHKALSFDIYDVQVTNPENTKLVGKIKLSGFGENSVYKGDWVIATGKLYRTRGSRQASISYADIKKLSTNSSGIDNLRRHFASGLSNVLSDPQAPFGLGLLIGQRTTLSSEAAMWLSMVGLTHIIAVSGYNLTIIVRFIHRLTGKRSRYQTVVFSGLVIGLFLLITGFSASIVRASIVCVLSLVAWYYGRKFRPLVILLLTACITAGWYPIYLWYDVGWYLSFLAFFGVLVLAPTIIKRYFKKPPKPLTMVIVESFSAQIMTIPIILYIFHQTSLIALVANALVVPLVPIAMLATLIAGLVGMFFPAVLAILALPAKLLLTYILDVAHLLSSIPGITYSNQLSFLGMAFIYSVIGFVCLSMSRNSKTNYDIITDEILI